MTGSDARGSEGLATAGTLDGESEAAVRAEERALDVTRLREVLAASAILWPVVALVYLPIALREGGSIASFAVPQLTGWIGIVAALRIAQRATFDDHAQRAVLAIGVVVPAIASGLVSIVHGGITSPFAHGVLCVLTAFAIAMPLPARRSWPWLAATTLAWPITLLIAARFVPSLAAQWDDPRLAADFQESAIAQLVGALLAGSGMHVQWHIRREVLVARERRRYRLEEKLGEGGMGTVFRAFHPGLGRAVALKILRDRADESLRARFVREVRATAVLEHPSTVRVLDCGTTDDGHLYYTMELLEGATLAELVRREGPLSPEHATHLVLQAARALAEAHARGLVHRDVKPENLFVTSQGGEHDVVKVLDFGIAKSLAADGSLTADGALVGTPRFMSLEQALGEPVDARADVYALGAVLYFAIAGAAPIEEPTIFAVVAAHAADTILPLSSRRADVPIALETLVMRCLAGDRAARFADAGELARALAETGLASRHRPRAIVAWPRHHAASDDVPTRIADAG
ncbi:serine/threonine-protein kinase [Sandaracinus amylolyticus]|uniref:serine/threonine-protein kinase n=1 Tax=Sandaracinus amylolyticus TaxID=927083 RepID=UPI001F3B51A4|nr:serine/threonine-protein kinase [Sandaracinus amylolyticus]UJR85713.1 Hypothetical protein I5071_77930 [Sandaracinus amylolyticus]